MKRYKCVNTHFCWRWHTPRIIRHPIVIENICIPINRWRASNSIQQRQPTKMSTKSPINQSSLAVLIPVLSKLLQQRKDWNRLAPRTVLLTCELCRVIRRECEPPNSGHLPKRSRPPPPEDEGRKQMTHTRPGGCGAKLLIVGLGRLPTPTTQQASEPISGATRVIKKGYFLVVFIFCATRNCTNMKIKTEIS